MPHDLKSLAEDIQIAIHTRNIPLIKQCISEHPELLNYRQGASESLLQIAIQFGYTDIMKVLFELGFSPNPDGPNYEAPLRRAIWSCNLEAAQFLLEHGADPNLPKCLIFHAIDAGIYKETDEATQLQFVKLMVEHGANVNYLFEMPHGKHTPLSQAILTGKHQIAEYLRSVGGEMPLEEPVPYVEYFSGEYLADQIVGYFRDKISPAEPNALVEIVPTTPVPIGIHVIKPSKKHKYYTLFTTGLSERPMNVPPGAGEYELAELVMFLPADWPMGNDLLNNRDYFWPLQIMRQIAAYPHNEDSWYGAPVTILATEEPPKRFAPGCPFSSMLMITNYDDLGPIPLSNGQPVQVYTLLPLYPEERQLEMNKGLPALFQGLDRHRISKIVNLTRPNVAKA